MDFTEKQSSCDISETSRTSEGHFLLPSDDEENFERIPVSTKSSRLHLSLLYLANSITLVLLFVLIFTRKPASSSNDPSLEGVYFPAKDAVEYQVHRFESAFYNRTAYMGPPSPELDARWLNLTTYGMSIIDDASASQLSEPTMANLDNPHEHIVVLDVFHQIHCLFSIRKFMYPEYYPMDRQYNEDGTEKKDTLAWMHLDHCIDSIRQSLMCSGDITPVVYHIDPRGTGLFPKLQGTHVCRNYDKITEWAREHDGSGVRFQFQEGDALLDLYRLDPQGYMQKGGSE